MTNSTSDIPPAMRENSLQYLIDNSILINVVEKRRLANGLLMTEITFKEPSEEFFNYIKKYSQTEGIATFRDVKFLTKDQFHYIRSKLS